jgi:hypothetical protein
VADLGLGGVLGGWVSHSPVQKFRRRSAGQSQLREMIYIELDNLTLVDRLKS